MRWPEALSLAVELPNMSRARQLCRWMTGAHARAECRALAVQTIFSSPTRSAMRARAPRARATARRSTKWEVHRRIRPTQDFKGQARAEYPVRLPHSRASALKRAQIARTPYAPSSVTSHPPEHRQRPSTSHTRASDPPHACCLQLMVNRYVRDVQGGADGHF